MYIICHITRNSKTRRKQSSILDAIASLDLKFTDKTNEIYRYLLEIAHKYLSGFEIL